MKIAREIALFTLGGSSYVGLELLWRRRSHISMFAAGGICFLLIGRLRQRPVSLAARVAAGAGIITAVEFVTGMMVNRDHRVWDYRDQWGNVKGQICPLFMALWVPVTVLAMGLYGLAEAGLDAFQGKNEA